jgi:hypothetical protein
MWTSLPCRQLARYLLLYHALLLLDRYRITPPCDSRMLRFKVANNVREKLDGSSVSLSRRNIILCAICTAQNLTSGPPWSQARVIGQTLEKSSLPSKKDPQTTFLKSTMVSFYSIGWALGLALHVWAKMNTKVVVLFVCIPL